MGSEIEMVLGISNNGVNLNFKYIQSSNQRNKNVSFKQREDNQDDFKKIYDCAKLYLRIGHIKRDFTCSLEGTRRANYSDEELKQKAQDILNQAFDVLNVKEEHRPKLVLDDKLHRTSSGAYFPDFHQISINPASYKKGIMELEKTLMHEATHCRDSILRSSINEDRVKEIVKNTMICLIQGDECEQIVYANEGGKLKYMTPPEMPGNMKNDFTEFAKENLFKDFKEKYELITNIYNYIYIKENSTYNPEKEELYRQKIQDFIDKLNIIMEKNPKFQLQYETDDKAIVELLKYSLSIMARYDMNIRTQIKTEEGNPIKIDNLTDDEIDYAEKSLVDLIYTTEAINCRNSEIIPSKKTIYQYSFSPEEVRAEINGCTFLIEKYSEELEKNKRNGISEFDNTEYLYTRIQKAKAIIKYKSIGFECRKLYKQLSENPDNQFLQEQIQKLEQQLNQIRDFAKRNNLIF